MDFKKLKSKDQTRGKTEDQGIVVGRFKRIFWFGERKRQYT